MLEKAYLDEKHISTDWIRDSFFDFCTKNPDKDKWVGYRNAVPYLCSTSSRSNIVTFKSIKFDKLSCIDLDKYFADMMEDLKEQNIVIKTNHSADIYRVEFYIETI